MIQIIEGQSSRVLDTLRVEERRLGEAKEGTRRRDRRV